MRPDILNPLFAEVTSLKGVGPGLAKPLERLRIARVVDVAFHLPTGHIDRFPRDELMVSDAGRVIAISLTVLLCGWLCRRSATRRTRTGGR